MTTEIIICDKGDIPDPPLTVDSSMGVVGGGWIQEIWPNVYEELGLKSYSYVMERLSIASEGNSTFFGEIQYGRANQAADSDGTTGILGGDDVCEQVDLATESNATDWGNLTTTRDNISACSNDVYCVFAGGDGGENILDYFTFASQSDASVWGTLSIHKEMAYATSDKTIGVVGGGWQTGTGNLYAIESFTFSTQSNADQWGSLDVALGFPCACTDGTTILWGGGYLNSEDVESGAKYDISPTDWIHSHTFASGGDVSEFGNINMTKGGMGGMSDSSNALWIAGGDFAVVPYIDKSLFASGGLATSFGNLFTYRAYMGSMMGGTLEVDKMPLPLPPDGTQATGDTALFAGGEKPWYGANDVSNWMSISIAQYSYSSKGLCNEFGTLTTYLSGMGGSCDNVSGFFNGGWTDDNKEYPGGDVNTIDKCVVKTAGNTSYFGDMLSARQYLGSIANTTTGFNIGGYDGSIYLDTIGQYDTASDGNETLFGTLENPRRAHAVCGNNVYALISGGREAKDGSTFYMDDIDKMSFTDGGVTTDWETLRDTIEGHGGCSDHDDIALWGMFDEKDDSYYFTIRRSYFSSASNANDFANAIVPYTENPVAVSNSQEALFAGGEGNVGYGGEHDIFTVSFASGGQTTHIGNLRSPMQYHGGLSDYAPATVTCDINHVFGTSSHFRTESIDFKSNGELINIFDITSKDTQIEMDRCTSNTSLDPSINAARKVKIIDSIFTLGKKLQYDHIKNLYVDKISVNADDRDGIETEVVEINNSDVYRLDADIELAIDKNVEHIIDGVVVNKSFVKHLNVDLNTTYYGDIIIPPEPVAMQIASGQEIGMLLKTDGTLWGTGQSRGNTGTASDSNVWVQESTGSTEFIDVSCGSFHTVALKRDGTIWGCGDNDFSQLGPNVPVGGTSTFTKLSNIDDWIAISAGAYHTIALRSDGSLWGVGNNQYGQMGLGYTSSSLTTFTPLTEDTNIASISAGAYNNMMIKSNGSLWGAGHNDEGQLGLGHSSSTSVFTQEDYQRNDWIFVCAGERETVAISREGGEVPGDYLYSNRYDGGWNTTFQQDENGFKDWVWADTSSASFEWGILAIRSDGTMWGMGDCGYGQLGHDDLPWSTILTQEHTYATTWVKAARGKESTIALQSNDTLWGAGKNGLGELGIGDYDYRQLFTNVPL